MNRRPPIIATLIAVAAIATMIALGVWQLQRKGEKEALLARYENASDRPPVVFPRQDVSGDLPLFRHSSVECLRVIAWRNISGSNTDGKAGYAHLATCLTGKTPKQTAIVAMGWSGRPKNPDWDGGVLVRGIIAPHKPEPIRLVATDSLAGLERLAVPSPDSIPNNHLLYAIQWFIFAFAATVIFLLAVRKKPADK